MLVVLLALFCEKFRQKEPPGWCDLRSAMLFCVVEPTKAPFFLPLFAIPILASLLWVKALLLLWVPVKKKKKGNFI